LSEWVAAVMKTLGGCGPEGAAVHSPVDSLTPLPAPLRAPTLIGGIEIRRLTTGE